MVTPGMYTRGDNHSAANTSAEAAGKPVGPTSSSSAGRTRTERKHYKGNGSKRRSWFASWASWRGEHEVGADDEDGGVDLEAGARPRATPLTGEDSLDGQFGYSRVAEAGGFDSADGADSFGGLDSAGFDSAGFDSADGDGGSNPGHDSALSQRRHYRKTLRPSATQLRSLGLQLGANTIEFSVHSSLQGTQIIASRLFLFESTSKLVISDVDGTITKSDVLGHLMPRVGYDWSHLGVTQLYSRIVANGYHMVYLTARGIGMAGTTRDYLKSVQQASASKAESRLPDGPCLLSPTGLVESLTREVIEKKPEEFKIACLGDLRSLWPPGHNPFYAGFGNRDSDVVSYTSVGVPSSRILVINPQGEIRISGQTYCWTSYPRLVELCHHMFPFLELDKDDDGATDDFSAFNFWRMPPAPLPPDLSEPNPHPPLSAATSSTWQPGAHALTSITSGATVVPGHPSSAERSTPNAQAPNSAPALDEGNGGSPLSTTAHAIDEALLTPQGERAIPRVESMPAVDDVD